MTKKMLTGTLLIKIEHNWLTLNPFTSRINPDQKDIFQYYTYGATIAEVELDVLTGEYQISRVDVEYDCGQR